MELQTNNPFTGKGFSEKKPLKKLSVITNWADEIRLENMPFTEIGHIINGSLSEMDYIRISSFIEEEKDFLMPLPASSYEMAVWSTATIQPDYLITIGNCKYSVPYEFIGKKVDIRATENSTENSIMVIA